MQTYDIDTIDVRQLVKLKMSDHWWFRAAYFWARRTEDSRPSMAIAGV